MTLNARTLLLICGTTATWAFSFGLGSQVVSHWLKDQTVSNTVIGLTHSFYYFGMAAGSFAIPWLARRLGPSGCTTIGMIGSGVTLALFPSSTQDFAYYLLRFLNGWAGAMSVIPLETIVSRDSAPDRKTQNFGYYGTAMVLGGGIGLSCSLELYEFATMLPFWLGGATPMATGLTLYLGMPGQSTVAELQGSHSPLHFVPNFLSYGTAWCQGFLEGFTIAFLSLYLVRQVGYSPSAAGVLVGIATVGILVMMIPLSWLGDRCGKAPVLLGCYAVTALGLLAIPFIEAPIALGFTLFVFGACTGAMYPLGLSLLTDRMSASGLARAYAWYLAIECIGSQLGAATVGRARDAWGEVAMFPVGLAAVVGVLAFWAISQVFHPARRASATADSEKKMNCHKQHNPEYL